MIGGNVVRSTHENSPDIRYAIHMHGKTALHHNNSQHPINVTTEQLSECPNTSGVKPGPRRGHAHRCHRPSAPPATS